MNAMRDYFWRFLTIGRKIRKRVSKRLWKYKKPLSRGDLVTALRRLSLPDDAVVCVHSSLSSLGKVDGGPTTVVEALIDTLGDNGTLVFPTFSLPGNTMEKTLVGDYTFDARNTPSSMGAITETARRYGGFIRSIHPTHSVIARGPLAEELTKDHLTALTPMGRGSPFFKMSYMNNAFILLLGSPFGSFPAGHCVQNRLESFPYRPYTRHLYEVKCIDAEGIEHLVKTYAHETRANKFRWDKDEMTRDRMERELRKLGVIDYFRVGAGRIRLINCVDLEGGLEKLLERGIMIFGTKERLMADEETRSYFEKDLTSYWRQ